MKRRFVYWLVDRLMSWIGERFEPLNYPTFYACVIERERVAEVSTNHHKIRARAIQLAEKAGRTVRSPVRDLSAGEGREVSSSVVDGRLRARDGRTSRTR